MIAPSKLATRPHDQKRLTPAASLPFSQGPAPGLGAAGRGLAVPGAAHRLQGAFRCSSGCAVHAMRDASRPAAALCTQGGSKVPVRRLCAGSRWVQLRELQGAPNQALPSTLERAVCCSTCLRHTLPGALLPCLARIWPWTGRPLQPAPRGQLPPSYSPLARISYHSSFPPAAVLTRRN